MSAQYNFFGATVGDVLRRFDTEGRAAKLADFEVTPGAGSRNGELEILGAMERAEDVVLAYLRPGHRRRLADDYDPEQFLTTLVSALTGIAAFSLADRIFGDGDVGWKKARADFGNALQFLRDVRDSRADVVGLEEKAMPEYTGRDPAASTGKIEIPLEVLSPTQDEPATGYPTQ